MKKTNHSMVVMVLTVMATASVLLFAACSDDTKSDEPEDTTKYTVSFALGYTTTRNPPASMTVAAGKAAGTLPTPVRPTWDFTGWKDESDKRYTRDTVINGDVALTAQWEFTPGTDNPIFRDYFTADPAPFVVDDVVYIVCGNDVLPPTAPNNEYYRMKQWLMYSTTDMKTFKYENVILKSEDFSFGRANSAWASQIIQGLDGRFYFYVTVDASGGKAIGVAVAETVTGPYVPERTPVVTRSQQLADTGVQGRNNDLNIDPTALIDDDGKAYLMWGQMPFYAELNEDMISIKGKIKLWPPGVENHAEWKSEDTYDEGPYLYKRGDWYYMFYPSGIAEAGYERISYSMAPSFNGPWTEGVRITGGAPGFSGGYCYTIHPGILEFKGQAYLFYHNARLSLEVDGATWNGATGRRSVAVDYLYFNEDGTIPFVTLSNDGISLPPVDQ
ncbi:MAG: family 43 glycosylhydrolase [Treponema sp.]|jgi:hypothetical protein|nr:family 43 glycosylhydrolase [Treponema sp.]